MNVVAFSVIDRDYILENAVLSLMPWWEFEKLKKGAIKARLADMAIVYQFPLSGQPCYVSGQLLAHYDISLREIETVAWKRLEDTELIIQTEDSLNQLLGMDVPALLISGAGETGAVVLLKEKTYDTIYRMLGGRFYLIPYCMDEVLVMSAEKPIPINRLHSVRMSLYYRKSFMESDDSILSESILLYDHASRSISIPQDGFEKIYSF